MEQSLLTRLWIRAWSLILADMTHQELVWLARPGEHISLLSARRTTIILSRARLVALLFAFLTPLWIGVDALGFSPRVWEALAAARVLATIAFLFLIRLTRRATTLKGAYQALTLLLLIPTAFYLFSYQYLADQHLYGFAAALAAGYSFLPYLMLAGLSIFPLTLAENLAFAAPLVAAQFAVGLLPLPMLDWATLLASLWLLALLTAVSALSGLSQLAFMIVLVRDAIRDSLTGSFSRHSGEELLELQFILSSRTGAPLSLAFVDLDHFKEINDLFGHDAGDRVLAAVATALRRQLRSGDALIRWGGEEFLLLMPNATAEQASMALARACQGGLALRPDGRPVTASIGIAERMSENLTSWQPLVDKADNRMYLAKRGGRNCIVNREGAVPLDGLQGAV